MATFVLMTKLSAEVTAKMKDRAAIGRAWLERVHEKCPGVKFIAHYGVLGPYDFIDIYEAPDEETAVRVSLISRAHGAVQAESWVAIPYKRLLDIAADV